jgi:DNA gyrase subunit A
VATTNELMLMSSGGTLVRTRAAEVSVLGRNTQGVRLIRLDEGERLIGVESVEPEPESDAEIVEGEPPPGDAAAADEGTDVLGAQER